MSNHAAPSRDWVSPLMNRAVSSAVQRLPLEKTTCCRRVSPASRVFPFGLGAGLGSTYTSLVMSTLLIVGVPPVVTACWLVIAHTPRRLSRLSNRNELARYSAFALPIV